MNKYMELLHRLIFTPITYKPRNAISKEELKEGKIILTIYG